MRLYQFNATFWERAGKVVVAKIFLALLDTGYRVL
jgi:hypothetical protein